MKENIDLKIEEKLKYKLIVKETSTHSSRD